MGNGLDLFQVCKQMGIEHFSAVGPVEPFDKCVLIWLAGLDISDSNAFVCRPFGERSRHQLRPVIQAYGIWRSVVIDKAVQNAN